MQVKLLRVLQDKEVVMVGSTRARKVDVRILASTIRMTGLVKKGLFREDLFFRIDVIRSNFPLYEREERPFASHPTFHITICQRIGKNPSPILRPGSSGSQKLSLARKREGA